MHDSILPEGWAPSIGYTNGILAEPGPTLYLAGQVGWNDRQVFESDTLAPQFEQALKNVLAVLHQAGGRAEHIVRITAFCIARDEYLASRRELGRIWREVIGPHYPAMSMIFVADLLDHPAKIELEATAVLSRP